MKKVIIIGSGLSGISAALELKKNNIDVLVIDKARNIGGRICSKISNEYIFNHGAQYFTAKTESFSNILIKANSDESLKKWKIYNNYDVYVGNPNMRSFIHWFSKGINFIKNTEIINIKYDKKNKFFYLRSIDKEFKADALIITAPAPQTAKLIYNIDKNFSSKIDCVEYNPCWTVMLKFKTNLKFSFLKTKNSNISFAVSEGFKLRDKNQNLITIHSNEVFANLNLYKKKEVVENLLINEFITEFRFNKKDIELIKSHRWLYSKVKKPIEKGTPFISKTLPFSVAGDWHPGIYDNNEGNGTRAEDAFLSGKDSVNSLINNYF